MRGVEPAIIRRWVCGMMLLCLGFTGIVPAFATTIVIVRTRNLIVIASDSKAQYQGVQGPPQVCKVAKQNETYFVVAGIAQDTQRGFLANRVVSSAIARGNTFEEQANAVASDMSAVLGRELSQMQSENPEDFKFAVTGDSPSSIGLVTIEGGIPKVIVLTFLYDKATGEISVRRDSCPGTCTTEYSVFQLGRALSRQEVEKISGSPTTLARTLVELEIARESHDVGPPIEILEIRPDESQWLEDDLNCSAQVNVRKKYPHAVTVDF